MQDNKGNFILTVRKEKREGHTPIVAIFNAYHYDFLYIQNEITRLYGSGDYTLELLDEGNVIEQYHIFITAQIKGTLSDKIPTLRTGNKNHV